MKYRCFLSVLGCLYGFANVRSVEVVRFCIAPYASRRVMNSISGYV